VNLTRANGFEGGIARESLFLDKTVPVTTRQEKEREREKEDREKQPREERTRSAAKRGHDAEKSPLFFLEPSRPRTQPVVSLKDFSVFNERECSHRGVRVFR